MRGVAVIGLVVAACASKASPPPTCEEVIDQANVLYVASRGGKDLGTQEDVMRSMNIHHVCEQMTPAQRRCVMAAKTIAATDGCELPIAGEPARAKPLPKDLTCKEVGAAWSDYLHNGNRKNKDWAWVAKDQQDDCERNTWSAEERACWVAIRGAADQQRCLDNFKHGSKPPPQDPDDSMWEDDADAG